VLVDVIREGGAAPGDQQSNYERGEHSTNPLHRQEAKLNELQREAQDELSCQSIVAKHVGSGAICFICRDSWQRLLRNQGTNSLNFDEAGRTPVRKVLSGLRHIKCIKRKAASFRSNRQLSNNNSSLSSL
jgi:hypothetical protein